jgi:kynureninase
MGHAAPFAFSDDYVPAAGIERLLTGTPPILGLAALEEGVRLIADAGIERLVAKSRALSEFFLRRLREMNSSPRNAQSPLPAGEGSGVGVPRPIGQDPHPNPSPRGRALRSDADTTVSKRLEYIGPTNPAQRGSQLSFRHPEAYALSQALIARGVIGDFRDPDILRFGLAPAYIRFEDCWHAAEALGEVLASGEWQRDEFRRRAAVT